MIRVKETQAGVQLSLISRPPLVYLDQWAIYRLANSTELRARFLAVLKNRGTVFFSWINVTEIADTSSDTGKRIAQFLDGIGDHWLPIESNPYVVMEREQAYKAGDARPCISESFAMQYYPHVHQQTLSLGKVVELVAGEGESAKRQLKQLKDTVLDLARQMRAKEKSDSGWAARTYPTDPFEPDKPVQFIYTRLMREVATNKGWTLTPNDGVDLYHCMVATGYSDFVLLDEGWTKRVRRLDLPPDRCQAFYEPELDLFFKAFEDG